jgi:hypothetical protein
MEVNMTSMSLRSMDRTRQHHDKATPAVYNTAPDMLNQLLLQVPSSLLPPPLLGSSLTRSFEFWQLSCQDNPIAGHS